MNDILLHHWQTPFQSFPFDKICQEDFEPAILNLLQEAQATIETICQDDATPTFFNTIEKMEKANQQLNKVVAAFFNLNSAATNDYLQQLAQKLAPALAAHSNHILLNDTLFQKIKKIYEDPSKSNLNPEQQRLLEETYKSFIRNGALLQAAQKEQLRAMDQRLAVLKMQFSENVLAETNTFQLHLNTETDIEGLPQDVLAAAKATASSENKEGYIFTLQFPSYVPFMKFAKNRAHRQALYLAYNSRGNQNNKYNNEAIIKELVQLKNKRAQLLGFKHHADFALAERMAKSTQNVLNFLNELLDKAYPMAVKEIEAIKELALADGITDFMPYDHAYYAEQLRLEKFNYSEEETKAYFPLEQVLEAAFALAQKLFGLAFKKTTVVAPYHPEVSVYQVLQRGQHKALLYTDFHPRAGKRPGAWMTTFQEQYKDESGNHRPHINIVCNFSRAQGDTPSLLTFNEVTTLFHEFGHALHGMLADTQYESLSGTHVYWDFVELPSQFLENYCSAPEFLSSFAKHWKDGKNLDTVTLNQIIKASNFMEAYQTVRQISFGLLDMAYYTGESLDDTTLAAFEQKAIQRTQLYPHLATCCMSTAFGHIFGGGYAAGYYSYKWAEVLDADAFAYFQEKGIFNPELAQKYEHLLQQGGTKDPMELYIQFRGRAPQVDALLKRAGLYQ